MSRAFVKTEQPAPNLVQISRVLARQAGPEGYAMFLRFHAQKLLTGGFCAKMEVHA